MKQISMKWVYFTFLLFLKMNDSFAVDFIQIEKDLKNEGCSGFIHGASESQGLYVFTYRNPHDFFDYVQMSLVAHDNEMLKALSHFGRHDQVKIQGEFLKNRSPQKHILVKKISLIKKFDSSYPIPAYEHEAKIPDELTSLTHATFLIHAIAGEGHILVLEYKDSIVPVFVKNQNLTQKLFRNDLVELKFKVRTYPDQPVHLELDEKDPSSVLIIDSIQSHHGEAKSITGALILFPKSPEIIFNVFAVQETLPANLSRQYTLVNFNDPAVFIKIREKLQAVWDQHPRAYINGRNKLISTTIKIKVTGTLNEVDANQANPQILIQSPDEIKILD